MAHINIVNCVVFILIQLCILSIVRAYYQTVHIKIKNGDEMIELNLKRTKQYIANENLPIWGNWKNKIIPMPHVMTEVGAFVTYHDVEKSSAVVYFMKGNFFYGLVDTRFIITKLPLEYIGQVAYFEVGGPYVIARVGPESGQYFHDDQDILSFTSLTDQEINYVNSLIDSIITPTLSPMPSSSQTNEYQPNYDKPSTSNQIEPILQPNVYENSYRPPSTVLFPEILVFISYGVISNFIKFHAIESVVLAVSYYITYFNAIDMLFAKLATNDIEIHINIAGLMIEFEEDVFPYKFSESGLHTLQNIPNLDAFQTIHESLPNYIRRHKAIFLRDAFDFIFISTHYPIEYDGKPIKGYSRKPFRIYNQRKSRKFYHTALGLVVQQKDAFGDYVIATGLIANLMDIKYDQPSEDLLYNREECVGIMHSSSNHCRRCLVWSKENQKQLKEYARSNTNRCFLLNYPRSLYPHDSRVRSMNPENQCSCYGFDIKDMDRTYVISIPIDKCAVGLQCSRPGEDVSSILPLDGTPCGNINAVCWNMKCVTINEGIDVDDCKESCTPPKRQKTTHEDIRNKKEFENY